MCSLIRVFASVPVQLLPRLAPALVPFQHRVVCHCWEHCGRWPVRLGGVGMSTRWPSSVEFAKSAVAVAGAEVMRGRAAKGELIVW